MLACWRAQFLVALTGCVILGILILIRYLLGSMADASPVQPGDRVRLSELGEIRVKAARGKTGIVLLSRLNSSRNVIRVLFAGSKVPVRLHRSYLERCDEGPFE